MRRTRMFLMLLASVLVGSLLAAGSAGAASRAYVLNNYSGHDLQLHSVKNLAFPICDGSKPCGTGFYPIDFEGRPHDGAVLKSDESPHTWDLKYGFGTEYAAELTYTIKGTDGSVEFTIRTSTFTNTSTCAITGATDLFCTTEGLSLSLRKGGPHCLAAPANHVDWSGCDQRGAYLWNARMEGANVSGANLSHAYMYRVYLNGGDATRANLQEADLTDAQMQSAGLGDAKMDYVEAYYAKLIGADMAGADLTGANLTMADLTRVDLRGADMTSATLRNTDLSDARCNNATVWPNGTSNHGSTCPTSK